MSDGFDRAARALVGTEQDTGGSHDRHVVGALIEADGRSELEMRRQRHPELEAAGTAGGAFYRPRATRRSPARIHSTPPAGSRPRDPLVSSKPTPPSAT